MTAKRTFAWTTEPPAPGVSGHGPMVGPGVQPEAAPAEPAAAAALPLAALAVPGTVNVSFALAFERSQPGASFWDGFSGQLPWSESEGREGGGHWETTIALAPGNYEYLGRLRGFLERTLAGADVFEVTYDVGCRAEASARPAWPAFGRSGQGRGPLSAARHDPAGLAGLTFHPEAASRRPARARGVCAGLVGSWWAQVPTRRLQTFVGGFQRVFLHSPEVVFIDNTQVEGKSLPVWPDSGAEGAYRICKLDHGSIHAMLKDFPTEPELRRTMQRLVAGALPEVPCYYWVLTYLPGLANGPGCLGKDLSELRTVVERV